MDEQDDAQNARPWYYDRLMELAAEGWVTANVEDYLGEDESIGAERLLYLDYALELAQSLQERTAYLGNSGDQHAHDLIETWASELEDPMNAERIFEEYEAWAKEWRPWEPALYRSEEAWRNDGKEEEHAGLLSRFDVLDPSSKPSTVVMRPLLAYPDEFHSIDEALAAVEEDEQRQRATIERAVAMLSGEGYDTVEILDMNILDGLDHVARLHDLHDVHEDLRLLIAEQIAPFDPELAAHHEQKRIDLVAQGGSADIGGLRIQISAIADNLHQRMALLNDLLNSWRAKGIIFPHSDGIRANELLEWEANLPEIEATLQLHLNAFLRWKEVTGVWPEEVEKAEHCAGHLEKTESFIDIVDDLDQRWKRLELECIKRIERFEHAGLAMDAWHEHLQKDPKAALNGLKQNETVLEKRVEFIERMANLDVSFEGAEEIERRIGVLRELEIQEEVLEDYVRFIEQHARRGARHRRMLEQDWRGLVAQGKASNSTSTASFTLAEFEAEIAQIRKFGTSVASTRTGASLIAGDVHDRLKARLEQELALLSGSGWAVEELEAIASKDVVLASRKLNAARSAIETHNALVRRLVCLPWNRDIALALDVEASLRNPLKLAMLSDQIAGYAQHLSSRPVEDESFEITSWAPKPPRKTLLPIPEHAAVRTMMPADALDDAHEAILSAMNGEQSEPASRRIKPSGASAGIVRPNDKNEPLEETIIARPRPKVPVSEPIPENQPPAVAPSSQENSTVPEEVDTDAVQMVDASSSAVVDALVSLLESIDMATLAADVKRRGLSAVPEVRRGLAAEVGVEPRDTRVDRFLRLSLRLMPQEDADDARRAVLILALSKGTKNLKRWMRVRLEHRHSGSSNNFLADAKELGGALERIPGPGLPLPLLADHKELPSPSDLPSLQGEVTDLIAHLNPVSAGGISA